MTNIWVPESFRDRPYAREQFQRMVAWASANHPFYQRFCPDPSRHVPILGRSDFTDNNDLLLNGHQETGRTSGSTGVPVRLSWSRLKEQREKHAHQIFLDWVGQAMDRVRLVSMREAQPGEHFMDICRPVADQVDYVLERGRQHPQLAVVTYPSNALQLAQYILDNGIDCGFVTRLVCYAESFDDEQESLLTAAFPNARIWNNYSASEVGMMALRCPHRPDYMHVMALNVGIEILDHRDRPCGEGEKGRIVVTEWFNQNTPFIRYDIGDMAVAGQCPCGRIPFPSMRSVLGKVRGFLKDRQGNRRIFANIGAELKKIDGLRQYQIIQEEIESLKVRYVINPGKDPETVESRMRAHIEEFIGFSPDFRFQRESAIERESNGKFYATICRI